MLKSNRVSTPTFTRESHPKVNSYHEPSNSLSTAYRTTNSILDELKGFSQSSVNQEVSPKACTNKVANSVLSSSNY